MKLSQTHLRLVAIASAFVFAAAPLAYGQEEDEAPERNVTIDGPTVARLGIGFGKLEKAEFLAQTRGFGVVMGFDTVAQTDSELTTAEVAVAASNATLARARALFAANVSVSRQTVEAAERQVAADAAQLALAQRKAVSVWGQSLPWRTPAERTALLSRLAAGDVALARVTLPTASVGDTMPKSLRFERVDAGQGAKGWKASTIWSAPADPTVPGRSFFALIEGAKGLGPGERLIVYLPMGVQQSGVVVPSSAVLIAESKAWYYTVERLQPAIPSAPIDRFNRVELDLSRPMDAGYFMADGQVGQEIVVVGAGLVLARETGTEEEE